MENPNDFFFTSKLTVLLFCYLFFIHVITIIPGRHFYFTFFLFNHSHSSHSWCDWIHKIQLKKHFLLQEKYRWKSKRNFVGEKCLVGFFFVYFSRQNQNSMQNIYTWIAISNKKNVLLLFVFVCFSKITVWLSKTLI